MKNKEIELKFGFEGDPSKLYHIFSNIGKVSNETAVHLDNTYFDTPSKDFFSIKAGLRIRTAENFSEQTLKVKGDSVGGLHKRSEFNVSISRDTKVPNLLKFPEGALPQSFDLEAMQQKLESVCNINFERQLFNLELLDSVFEVAYDHGTISTKEGGDYALSELEIELKETSVRDEELMNLFSVLCTHLGTNDIPLLMEPFSKMHRATLLMDPSKRIVDLNVLNNSDDLIDHISKLVSLSEQLYGMFLVTREVTMFRVFCDTLNQLVSSLKVLKRRRFFAFIPSRREPVEYSHDLKVIAAFLKRFACDCTHYAKKMTQARLKGNEPALNTLFHSVRKSEKDNKLFLIPLKLRLLLSLLSK